MGDAFGGKQPSPPTLDTAQSQKLTQADYSLKQKNTPGLVETTGKAGREEYARNIAFALQGFTDPSSIYQGEIEDLREARKKAQGQLDALTGARQSSNQWGKTYLVDGKWLGERDYKKRVAEAQRRVDRSSNQIQRLRDSDPVADLQKAFRQEFKLRDNLLGDMRSAEKSTKEYKAMQRALKAGTDAQEVGIRSADLSQATAAQMDQVADVRAAQVGAGALGDTLMSRAMERAASDGRLSAEATRDAVQSARQGMAARGMATGGAGLAAELLNRDRFSRARMAEDLAFAQGIQDQDLTRQFNNASNTLQADLANQTTAFNTGQFNASNQQAVNLANMDAANNMAQYNTTLAANTDQFNALQRADTDRFNLGLLQTSATAADNERARQLGLGQTAYNFALQTNPKLMLAGLGEPYANFTPQALGLMNNTNVQPIYSGGSFGNPYMTGSALGDFGLKVGTNLLFGSDSTK